MFWIDHGLVVMITQLNALTRAHPKADVLMTARVALDQTSR